MTTIASPELIACITKKRNSATVARWLLSDPLNRRYFDSQINEGGVGVDFLAKPNWGISGMIATLHACGEVPFDVFMAARRMDVRETARLIIEEVAA